MAEGRRWLQGIYRVSYWILPVIILTAVFRRIDFLALKSVLNRCNPWFVLVGLAYYPIVIMIGGWRWRVLLARYLERRVSAGFIFRHYWIGLALGFFMPGSVGWDAYRVAMAGRQFGEYAKNVVVILVEKLLALFACATIILALSPYVPLTGSVGIARILDVAFFVMTALLITAAAILLILRNRKFSEILERAEAGLSAFLSRIAGTLRLGKPIGPIEVRLSVMIEPLASLRTVLSVLSLSFGIQLLGALASQMFFIALGHPISFLANFFVSPILFFIFLLPISFGSLGVREGSYILLYGMFGVPAETALLVSFFNLIGVLLNNALGGIVMLLSGPAR